jgi:hypothetical protein
VQLNGDYDTDYGHPEQFGHGHHGTVRGRAVSAAGCVQRAVKGADMPDLPKGLKARQRGDGRLDIVGTNVAGNEYVARTTDQPGVTDYDLKILDIGNPDKRDANAFVGFYRDQRDNARKAWEHSLDMEYLDAADRTVHAGLHLRESRTGYSSRFAQEWERLEKLGYV